MIPFYAITEDFVKSSKTRVTSKVIASDSPVILSVENNEGFAKDDYVIVKREGEEQAHICLIDSVSGTKTIVLHDLKHDLNVGDEITKIAFNKRRLYGSATKDGTYTFIEEKDIAVNNPQGTYFIYEGNDYTWFKATYFNEKTLTETSLDDAIPTQAGEGTHYCSIYDIREESGFLDNAYISDGRIDALRIQAEAEVDSYVGSVYALPLKKHSELLRLTTKLLAAGMLMFQEYGEEASGTSKDGKAKIQQAEEILKKIANREIKLLDENKVELELNESSIRTLKGYPDETAPFEERAKFTIDKEF